MSNPETFETTFQEVMLHILFWKMYSRTFIYF